MCVERQKHSSNRGKLGGSSRLPTFVVVLLNGMIAFVGLLWRSYAYHC